MTKKQMQERIEQLEKALRPFAENYWPGDHISMSDVDRAKEAMAAKS